MIQPERIKSLNPKAINPKGDFVIYWMQAAQRADWNHALEFAIEKANELKKPLLAVFCLVDNFPEANYRHYQFMLEGLADAQKSLENRGVKLVIQAGSPEQIIPMPSKKAAVLITDAGHLRIQKLWRKAIAEKIDCPMYEVETNLTVPIWTASEKENYSAGTIRPRIQKQLSKFLIPIKQNKLQIKSLNLNIKSLDITKTEKVLSNLKIDCSVKSLGFFTGGPDAAIKLYNDFIKNRFDGFGQYRNDPSKDYLSNMSPYLHFGQISPLYLALEAVKTKSKSLEAFLEELIIRRELSHNFIYYNDKYDSFDGLPAWCKRTLNFHAKDKREYIYTLEQLETAKTHDPYWNAAQKEMVLTGKMHGYMRMYWGKKIIEWTKSPQTAFEMALYLNNKYELDGRDPNGFTGVAWCFGKHDRAWGQRNVFGNVRYMNSQGLKRKFDIEKYVKKVDLMFNEKGIKL